MFDDGSGRSSGPVSPSWRAAAGWVSYGLRIVSSAPDHATS